MAVNYAENNVIPVMVACLQAGLLLCGCQLQLAIRCFGCKFRVHEALACQLFSLPHGFDFLS